MRSSLSEILSRFTLGIIGKDFQIENKFKKFKRWDRGII
jgi:hypothetical protein